MFNKLKVGQEFYHHSSDNPFLDKDLYARIVEIKQGKLSNKQYVRYNTYRGWSVLVGSDTLEMSEFRVLYPHRRGS